MCVCHALPPLGITSLSGGNQEFLPVKPFEFSDSGVEPDMDMTGSERIAAPRERVYEALNDPEILKAAIPGCESIEKTSDTAMTATVVTKVGPVKAKFQGAVTLSDFDPPNGYTISGEGKGGPAGFAKGGAKVRLEDDGGATILHYEVKADVGGKLAQLGSRLIDSTARKLSGEFFSRFAEIVAEPAAEAVPEGAGEQPPVAAQTAPAAAPAEGGSRIWIWGLAAIVVALAAYLFLSG